MSPFALLLSFSLAQASAPVLVVVSTQGLPERDRAAVVAHIVAEVDGAGVTAALLPRAVAPGCATDVACARALFVDGDATRAVVVDILRAGSRASIAARAVDREGHIVAEFADVVLMTKLVAGKATVVPKSILIELAAPAAQAPTPPAAPPSPSTASPSPTPATTPATTPAVTTPAPAPTTSAPAPAPTTSAPETSIDPGLPAILGVGVTAVGALFLIGATAAALGQNAVRLDPDADGGARANTAVTIPLSLGVAALGAAAVGVGAFLLVGADDDSAAVAAGS